MVGADFLRFVGAREMHLYSRVRVLERRDWAIAMDAITQPRCKRIGDDLIATLEMKYVARKRRDAATPEDRCVPDAEQRRGVGTRGRIRRRAPAARAREPSRRIRRAILREQIADRH